VIFRHCLGVNTCFVGRSAVRWADWVLQTVFCVEQLLLTGRSAVRSADFDVQTVFCGKQLPFGWSVSGPMGGLGYSDSVLWLAAAF
jgi:hypothetical protein